MITVILMLLAVLVFLGGLLVGKGLCANRGTQSLLGAIDQIRKEEYGSAKKSLVEAARMRPALKDRQEIKELYELLLSGRNDEAAHLAGQIATSLPNWPKSKLDAFVLNPWIQAAGLATICVVLVIKFLNF